MANRTLDALEPGTRRRAKLFLLAAKEGGLELLVTCTLRTAAEQAALFAQGRTAPGRIVTYAPPGSSLHEQGRALDVVPLRNGKPVWGIEGADRELWTSAGCYGEWAGLDWAGRWKNFREFPHFQYTGTEA